MGARAKRGGRFGFRRVRRSVHADAGPDAAPPPAPPTLAGLPADVERLRAAGHHARLSDATSGTALPGAVVADVAWLVTAGVDVILRRATAPVRVHIRFRVEDDELVGAMQSANGNPGEPAIVLTEEDLAPIGRRVAAAGGRLIVRPTHEGNLIAIVRLPLEER